MLPSHSGALLAAGRIAGLAPVIIIEGWITLDRGPGLQDSEIRSGTSRPGLLSLVAPGIKHTDNCVLASCKPSTDGCFLDEGAIDEANADCYGSTAVPPRTETEARLQSTRFRHACFGLFGASLCWCRGASWSFDTDPREPRGGRGVPLDGVVHATGRGRPVATGRVFCGPPPRFYDPARGAWVAEGRAGPKTIMRLEMAVHPRHVKSGRSHFLFLRGRLSSGRGSPRISRNFGTLRVQAGAGEGAAPRSQGHRG